MSTNEFIATSSISINAPVEEVWDALINPRIVKQYFFGTTVASTWKVGDPITFSGVWEGKEYTDTGKVLQFEPKTLLQYTHYSAMTGEPDVPENYHTVTFGLTPSKDAVTVTIVQDNNKTAEASAHSAAMWDAILADLKKLLEASVV